MAEQNIPAGLHKNDRENISFITSLQNRIATLEGDVTSIQSDTSAATSLSSLDARVTALESVPVPTAFTSTDQIITASGALTIPHGLGALPNLASIWSAIVCQSPEGGHLAGDIVMCPPVISNSVGNAIGLTITPTATSLVVQFGAGLFIANASGGALFTITNANWLLRVGASL